MLERPQTEAELVLVEPGAAFTAMAALPSLSESEQNHVLLLAPDESLTSFSERAGRRVQALRQASHRVSRVAYFVGHPAQADWAGRTELLSNLCRELPTEGSVALFAPVRESVGAMGCVGDLQTALQNGVELRARFSDAPAPALARWADAPVPATADSLQETNSLDDEERSGIFARPERRRRLRPTGT
jgi:hypothetical protein